MINYNSTGGDPNGVDFIGTAGSEQTLLGYAYAMEQGLKARATGPAYMVSATVPNPGLSGAPSETFQNDWRCVPGSAFFSPNDCNPGDVESPNSLSVIPTSYPVGVDVGGDVTPTLGLTIASSSTSLGTFVPGIQNDYTTSVAATVTSTGGDATLTVSDPGPQPRQADQRVVRALASSTEPLRSGHYGKTVLFTLSTSTP